MLIMDETQESKTSRPSARSQGLVLKPQNPIGTSVAWTFRIRWDDSQAIIRTWQILPWRLPAVDFRDFTMAECFLGVLCRTATYRSSCACVCCTRSQNLGQQNSMASQLFPLKHSTKLYGVATLSFEALTPRKRTPQHRKNKYQNNQNISKYPYANDWLDLTWSTLIRHVWLHWYMASYSMGHPSTTAPHKRSTSNEAFKRLKVSLPFSKHARHWIPIPSDQTSPPGRMFINFPREF